MNLYRPILVGLMVAGASLVSCTDGCGCTPVLLLSRSVIHGSVVNNAGAPVPGAFVNIQVRESGCLDIIQERNLAASAAGLFSVTVELDYREGTLCTRVRAGRSNGTMLVDSAVVLLNLEYTLSVPDTTDVVITLP